MIFFDEGTDKNLFFYKEIEDVLLCCRLQITKSSRDVGVTNFFFVSTV